MSLLSSNPSHRQPQPQVGQEKWLSHLATQGFESACLAIDDIETLSYQERCIETLTPVTLPKSPINVAGNARQRLYLVLSDPR